MARVLVIGLINGGIYGLLALGIVLVYRGSRVLNFAQGELGTVGLYLAFWLSVRNEMPFWVGALGAVLLAVVIGLLFEWLVVRRMIEGSRLAVAVGTVGLLLFLITLELQVFSGSPRLPPIPVKGDGFSVAGVIVSRTQVLSLVVVIVIGLALAALLKRTDFGLGVLAAADDPVAVRLVGVKLWQVSAFTWGVGAALSAIAALFIAPTVGVFTPGFASEMFVKALAAALIGGLVSLPGAFIGGIAVGLIEAGALKLFSESALPGVEILSVFITIVVVLLVRPQGLLGSKAAA
ncbi:MAG TPA: branched-chain amino acid ABC transporter permease [Mycobacteriales bacterium]|nr:branched-chain amino acid ABC transporter permease [Mycobacteriales bacterium]